MPFRHKLQGSRFELKYLISENCARAVRNFADSYLVPDEHAANNPNREYGVHSLYLDSPDLALCRATLHGEQNRFKLRVRFYSNGPNGPGYFEIKRRLNTVICKQRAAVKREAVRRLLVGRLPEFDHLANPAVGRLGTLQRFYGLASVIGAEGRVWVSYRREAYVTPEDNSVRLTFDRQLMAGRYEDDLSLSNFDDWLRPTIEGVILELKFTDRFPLWMRDMVHVFNLEQRSMAKYVRCVQALTHRGTPLARLRRDQPREARA